MTEQNITNLKKSFQLQITILADLLKLPPEELVGAFPSQIKDRIDNHNLLVSQVQEIFNCVLDARKRLIELGVYKTLSPQTLVPLKMEEEDE